MNTWVNTSVGAAPIAYQPAPAWVNFTIGYGNVTAYTISAATATVFLEINDLVLGADFLNYSVPIVSGQTSYSIELDQAFLGCSAANCLATMPDTYSLSLWSSLDGTLFGGTLGTNVTLDFATFTWVPYLATAVGLTGVSGPTTVSVLPAWVNFTIAYSNVEPSFSTSPANTVVNLEIYDATNMTDYLVIPVTIVPGNYSSPAMAAALSYSIMLDSTVLDCSAANCTASMPDTYTFSLWISLDGTQAGGVPASGNAIAFSTTSFVNALPTWINAAGATGPGEYSPLPAWINFTLAYGNVGPSYEIGAANTSVWLSVLNEVTHATANYSVPLVLGQASYSLALTTSGLTGCSQANCTTTFGSMNDTYAFNLWPGIDGTAYRGMPTVNGTLFVPISVSSFILFAPTFSLSAPGAAVTAGNITITSNYTAQYLVTAQVNVYSVSTPTGVAVLVFSASALKPAGTTVGVSSVWYEGTPGSYVVSFASYLSYETVYVNRTVTVNSAVTPGGGIIYQNTTIYNNVTGGSSAAGFFGLNPAVSGTLFLLVGLIVGILAGLIAARMIMSSGPSKPPQQWSDKKDEETSNTCSVCGKSFGSADELAAHSKSEHGMQ